VTMLEADMIITVPCIIADYIVTEYMYCLSSGENTVTKSNGTYYQHRPP